MHEAGISGGEALEIFGARAGPGMLALLSNGVEGYKKYVTELENAEGATEKMSETMQEGIVGSLTRAESAWSTLKVQLGEQIAPLVEEAVGNFTDLATWLQEDEKALKALGEVFNAVAGILYLPFGIIAGLAEIAGNLKTIIDDARGANTALSELSEVELNRKVAEEQAKVVKAYEDVKKAAKEAGLTLAEFYASHQQGGVHERASINRLESAQESYYAVKGSVDEYRTSLEEASVATNEGAGALGDLGDSAGDAAGDVDVLTSAVGRQAQAWRDLKTEISTVITATEVLAPDLPETVKGRKQHQDYLRNKNNVRVAGGAASLPGIATPLPPPPDPSAHMKYYQELGEQSGMSYNEALSEQMNRKDQADEMAGYMVANLGNSLGNAIEGGDWAGEAMNQIVGVFSMAGPWGAALGGVVGGMFSLFNKRSAEKRKAQEKARKERIKRFEEERKARVEAIKEAYRLEHENQIKLQEEKLAAIEAKLQKEREAIEETYGRAMDDIANQVAFIEEKYGDLIDKAQGEIDRLNKELEELGERFGKAVEESFEWGRITGDLQTFLDNLPDHIDSDAIAAKIQSGLDQLAALEVQRKDVTGLQQLAGKYAPGSALSEAVETGEYSKEAEEEYVKAGGDREAFREFFNALEAYNAEDGQTQENQERLAEAAGVLQKDTYDVLFKIWETEQAVLAELNGEVDSLKTQVTDPITTEIEKWELEKKTYAIRRDAILDQLERDKHKYERDKIAKLKDIERRAKEAKSVHDEMLKVTRNKLNKLLDKEFVARLVQDAHPGARGQGPDSVDQTGGGAGGGTPTAATGGVFGVGDDVVVGERGKELVRFLHPGQVIPNGSTGSPGVIKIAPHDIIIQQDGKEIARATAEYLPIVLDELGYH